MTVVNMHEAKTHLSRLVDRAASGEDIVIGRAGKPVARLVPYDEPAEPKPRRVPGMWKGRGWVADDFDDTPEEIIDLFYEGEA